MYIARVPINPRVDMVAPIVVLRAFNFVSSVLMNLPAELEYFMVFHLFLPTRMPHPPVWARWMPSRKKKRDPEFIFRGVKQETR